MKKFTLLFLFLIISIISFSQSSKFRKIEFGFFNNNPIPFSTVDGYNGSLGSNCHLRYKLTQLSEKSCLDVCAFPGFGAFASAGSDQETNASLSIYAPVGIDLSLGNDATEDATQRFGFMIGAGFATSYTNALNYGSVFLYGPEVSTSLRAHFFNREHFYRLAYYANVNNTYSEIKGMFSIIFTRPLRSKIYSGSSFGSNKRINLNTWTR